jgi:replicative DNA helicase
MADDQAHFQLAADVLAGWCDDVLSGKPPVLYPVGGSDLARVEVGPGLVNLIGGAPGTGKTSLVMQMIFDALRLTDTLRAVVCNVEMSAAVLFDRQLARLSGIDLTTIRYRRLTGKHTDRIDQAMATLEPLAERLCFVRPPFTLENVAATADAFDAELIVLDYLQRIPPPGDHGDRRGAVDATMNYLRRFADAGTAILAVAVVGRTRDGKGRSSYQADGLGLASFKESGELEYGADSAYLLCPDPKDDDLVTLRCLKDRYGEPEDIDLRFTRKLQRFDPIGGDKGTQDKGKLNADLAALWLPTSPSDDDNDD